MCMQMQEIRKAGWWRYYSQQENLLLLTALELADSINKAELNQLAEFKISIPLKKLPL